MLISFVHIFVSSYVLKKVPPPRPIAVTRRGNTAGPLHQRRPPVLLELMPSNRDSVKKEREAYLIERVVTLEPRCINTPYH